MCGIVGYTGTKQAATILIDGLEALEYRGYDSAGIAVVNDNKVEERRTVGRVKELVALVKQSAPHGTTGIGHTRWATHGGVTLKNTHPHRNSDNSIWVVHNGIIENHQELRSKLQENGYVFYSETDTEVVPNLIDYHYNRVKDVAQAFELTLQDLHGAFAIAMTTSLLPKTIFAARLSGPLVIGIGKGESAIASDPSALPPTCSNVIFLGDYEYAVINPDSYVVKNFKDMVHVKHTPEYIDNIKSLRSDKGGYKHFMIKEIHDIPETIRAATAGRARPAQNTVKLGGLDTVESELQFIDRIILVACGTSYYAGLVGEYLIEEIANIPVEVCFASEFRYRNEPYSRSTAVIALSQSGETADTLAALKKVESSGMLLLGIVNAPGSTIARTTRTGVYCHAGPEQSVASTKAFIAQVCVLALVSLYLTKTSSELYARTLTELTLLDKKIEKILAEQKIIQKIANKYASYANMMFIGRRHCYPAALEGALKLKEVSYIHAEAYAAGELKHGPLALIDEGMPTVAILPHDDLYDKTISSIQEIKARGGKVIILTDKKTADIVALADDIIVLPETTVQLQPVIYVTALQLLAYYVALEKGLDIDMPRNLAKSVTVE